MLGRSSGRDLTFDASFDEERKLRSQEGVLHRVEKGAIICTMIEFSSTVIHRVTGSSLAAETAALTFQLLANITDALVGRFTER